MPELLDVTLERCDRPSDDEVAALDMPYRPFPAGNGWYAHYFYLVDGTPSYKRLTHGDHADLWYRVLDGTVPEPTA